MAGTALTRKATGHPESDLAALVAEHNKVVADLEAIRASLIVVAAQLDDDGGVTGTTFEANADLVAAGLTAATIATV